MGSSVRFINRITNDFPMLSRNVNGTRLVYLDSLNQELQDLLCGDIDCSIGETIAPEMSGKFALIK